jgi:putative spermidine/putrescine transport system permease protein
VTATTTPPGRDAVSASRPVSPGIVNALGTVPFFAYAAVFLVLPTFLVVVGAFQSRSGGFTLNGFAQVLSPATVTIFGTSLWISLLTALVGAVAGGVIAYALSLSPKGRSAGACSPRSCRSWPSSAA